MRLFAKIFICSMLLLSMAVLFSGYLLITYSYEDAINRETGRALTQYQYDKFSVEAQLIANAEDLPESDLANDDTLKMLSSNLNSQIAFFSQDETLLFSNLPAELRVALPGGVSDDTIVHGFQKLNEKVYLTVSGKITQGKASLYLLTATEITEVFTQKQRMVESFQQVYFATVLVSVIFIVLLSALLTRPIKKLIKATTRIAGGDYHERLAITSGDEIGELSGSFNLMSEAIEGKINELSATARQKEDFVASFAHELKTPLTSVIGYADMLYQKNLPAEEVKNAAWYILSEGLRLEALSLKLMDLIVLNRQDFVLEEMQAQELLQNIIEGLAPLFQEKAVHVHLSADSVSVRVEYDLLKTLLLNLIDNSIKADCTDIWIAGEQAATAYHISVIDNGQGIPPAELDRITEAFYMVDKSRSRKQHGVGLGLALASRIAEIHGGSLKFACDETKKMTTAAFDLMLQGGSGND